MAVEKTEFLKIQVGTAAPACNTRVGTAAPRLCGRAKPGSRIRRAALARTAEGGCPQTVAEGGCPHTGVGRLHTLIGE